MGALALTAVTALLVSGIATLVASHVVRLQRESDYALALHLADAGLNAELNQMNGIASRAHTAGSPLTGSITGVEGTYTAWVEDSAGGTWSGGEEMWVVGRGTIGGISRTVRARGERKTVFADFTVFGLDLVTFGGSGSYVNDTLGTNNRLDLGSRGSAAVTGSILLAGNGATNALNPSGSNIFRYGSPIGWPSVDEIATQTHGSWANIRNIHTNNRMREFVQVNGLWTTRQITWPGGVVPTYLESNELNINRGPDNTKTLILPPGEYYFSKMRLHGNLKLIIDTVGNYSGSGVPGEVHIWMGDSTENDVLSIDVFVNQTSNDPRPFRLYYNKCTEFRIDGTSEFYGAFYAVRQGCSSAFRITGNSGIYGAVIGSTVEISGNSFVRFPTYAQMDDATDFVWYGIKDSWEEIAPAGGRVFPDGTND